MTYNCIEMNNNKNCLFGDTTGRKICLYIDIARLTRPPEEKPCEDCIIYYRWWDLKREEIRVKKLNEFRIAEYD